VKPTSFSLRWLAAGAAVLLVVTVAVPTLAGATARSQEEATGPPLIVVILDDSSSMSVDPLPGTDPAGTAAFAASQLVRFLPAGTRFRLYTFASLTTTPGYPATGAPLDELIVTEDGRQTLGDRIESALRDTNPKKADPKFGAPHPYWVRHTPCEESLRAVAGDLRANRVLAEAGSVAYVFLTDGECWRDGGGPYTPALATMRGSLPVAAGPCGAACPEDRTARFFLAPFGDRAAGPTLEPLTALAEETGGSVLRITKGGSVDPLAVFEVFGAALDRSDQGELTWVVSPEDKRFVPDYSQARAINVLITESCDQAGCAPFSDADGVPLDVLHDTGVWEWPDARLTSRLPRAPGALVDGAPKGRFRWYHARLRTDEYALRRAALWASVLDKMQSGRWSAVFRPEYTIVARFGLHAQACEGAPIAIGGRTEYSHNCAVADLDALVWDGGQTKPVPVTRSTLRTRYGTVDDIRAGADVPSTLSGDSGIYLDGKLVQPVFESLPGDGVRWRLEFDVAEKTRHSSEFRLVRQSPHGAGAALVVAAAPHGFECRPRCRNVEHGRWQAGAGGAKHVLDLGTVTPAGTSERLVGDIPIRAVTPRFDDECRPVGEGTLKVTFAPADGAGSAGDNACFEAPTVEGDGVIHGSPGGAQPVEAVPLRLSVTVRPHCPGHAIPTSQDADRMALQLAFDGTLKATPADCDGNFDAIPVSVKAQVVRRLDFGPAEGGAALRVPEGARETARAARFRLEGALPSTPTLRPYDPAHLRVERDVVTEQGVRRQSLAERLTELTNPDPDEPAPVLLVWTGCGDTASDEAIDVRLPQDLCLSIPTAALAACACGAWYECLFSFGCPETDELESFEVTLAALSDGDVENVLSETGVGGPAYVRRAGLSLLVERGFLDWFLYRGWLWIPILIGAFLIAGVTVTRLRRFRGGPFLSVTRVARRLSEGATGHKDWPGEDADTPAREVARSPGRTEGDQDRARVLFGRASYKFPAGGQPALEVRKTVGGYDARILREYFPNEADALSGGPRFDGRESGPAPRKAQTAFGTVGQFFTWVPDTEGGFNLYKVKLSASRAKRGTSTQN